MESLTGHPAPAAGEAYADFVARRISTLAHEARSTARRDGPDPGAVPPPAVRRAWALPEVVALAALALALAVALVA
jgi:hypothetical protein